MKIRKAISITVCLAAGLGLAVLMTSTGRVDAHCQIPCGIYDDGMRISMLDEHIRTIEKSMNQINELSKNPGENANQLIRWTMNKEDHADEFADIVTWYFLQQRIKPTEARSGDEWESYILQVRLCHEMLVEIMKAKQTTDLSHVENLRSLVDQFGEAYFTDEEWEHLQGHRREGS